MVSFAEKSENPSLFLWLFAIMLFFQRKELTLALMEPIFFNNENDEERLSELDGRTCII